MMSDSGASSAANANSVKKMFGGAKGRNRGGMAGRRYGAVPRLGSGRRCTLGINK